jgi:carboxyl-terminal processing protease
MVKAAKNERYDESLDDMLEQLGAMIKDDKMSNMQTYRQEIIKTLNYEIALRYAYMEGALELATMQDAMVESAVELLLDSEEYQRILREQDLSMH